MSEDALPQQADRRGKQMSKTWYITGTSRGFGRAWALAALQRGDRVAATARDVGALAELMDEFGAAILPIKLDVTDRTASQAALRNAHAHFGRLDVVVNNAGYGHFGAVEELSEAEARAQLETNFFGALWTTQAAIPLLRSQGGGHILQVSSQGGVVAFPTVGIYHASKWALEGLTEALAGEVAQFGIKTTLIAPGEMDPGLKNRLDSIISTAALADLPHASDAKLTAMAADLEEFEREVSKTRRSMHVVLDRLKEEIVRRYRTGEANVDDLLSS